MLKFKNYIFITFATTLFPIICLSQEYIFFESPICIRAVEKINTDIKKDSILFISGIKYIMNDGFSEQFVIGKNKSGTNTSFNYKKLDGFEFEKSENIYHIWDKNLLKAGVYSELLEKGIQYSVRNELNEECVEYINSLNLKGQFFNDLFLEDYLYTLLNKIHRGILNGKRPGNLYIKIIKDHNPNAFALSNGCIIISTGLLSTIQSEDELVGVLAHEVAHFVLDHQILNFNKEIDRKKRAEFWAKFATVVAAGADAYLTYKNENHIPGILTVSTAIASTIISEEITTRLGIKYNQEQELEADRIAKEILGALKYDELGLSAALSRIKKYCIITGNYLALSGSGSHPSLESRISQMGNINDFKKFIQSPYLKKVSLINSFNAWIELWYFAHHLAAEDLSNRNIINNVGTESDYIVNAIVKRRLYNSEKSNKEVLELLGKAKELSVAPMIILSKEEGLSYIRIGKINEAKLSFENYLKSLSELYEKEKNRCYPKLELKSIEEEMIWTRKMIFKVANF